MVDAETLLEASLNTSLRPASFTDTLWYTAEVLYFGLLPIIYHRVKEILLYIGDPSTTCAYLNLRLVT
jgi:hypothetical protein